MDFVSTGNEEARSWSIAYTVLVGVILLAVLPFTFLSLAKNHYGRDPARGFVPWLKAAFLLFCLTLCLLFVALVLATCAAHDIGIGIEGLRAAYHMSYLSELFQTLSAAAVMVTLLELGPGMHRAIQGVSSGFDKALKYFAWFLAFVVAALAIAFYGLFIDLAVNYSNGPGVIDRFGQGPETVITINKLIAATAIILWVASLIITSLSVYTWLQRKTSPLKTASTLYLVASLLNLLSSTWFFAYAVHWLLDPTESMGRYVAVLTVVLGWWTRGILLIIVYFIAVRSGTRGGVWSDTGHHHSLRDSDGYTNGTDYRQSYSGY
ncbi:hypothetical protein N658DRAFT_484569 [Parathielavia hyrcaniae]|uniref:Uncharacterized protein n=1 Tax=Parathielavia hyrcaniae TaxID=113614 RepID=A0AAN6Q8H6_9PEZI|nr:hypothetical protein N658DRAFT_484569 [Parathielavia hyrcaniae]